MSESGVAQKDTRRGYSHVITCDETFRKDTKRVRGSELLRGEERSAKRVRVSVDPGCYVESSTYQLIADSPDTDRV
jgi:hypothetical protein